MARARTRTFRNGNSEAVRLPKEVAFGQDGLELSVERHGDVLLIFPLPRTTLDEALAKLAARGAPRVKWERPPFEAPLRPGWIDDDPPD